MLPVDGSNSATNALRLLDSIWKMDCLLLLVRTSNICFINLTDLHQTILIATRRHERTGSSLQKSLQFLFDACFSLLLQNFVSITMPFVHIAALQVKGSAST